MKLKKTLILLVSCITLAACSAKPKQDYDVDYNFSQLKQFTIQSPQALADPLSGGRIEKAIDIALTSQGYSKSDEAAQFAVTYALNVADKPKSSGLSIGIGGGSWGKSSGVGVGTSVGVPLGSGSTKIETIQIDIIDMASNKLIWRGSDKFEFDDGGEEKANDTQATVSKILAEFPPKP
ncbi:DUF4136 domain-containing protein [Shewanella sp. Isolate11]|uniref:DUF4136 domain-containing protein n=1 Tax=Shewanella sp. Isolate11 TaxID=2908530 RepID=UPI001EFC5CC5|nr:DUF4136 domain-containing protein [Shewanella sp. Isolate11]MCG9695827.1 DUF4136 domain-containing protein [Shewanella sp. Isolate11]